MATCRPAPPIGWLLIQQLPRGSPLFFFFNDTATTEIYTLSLHDALPISSVPQPRLARFDHSREPDFFQRHGQDRKSTRLNSSHGYISYAVFCLKKKKLHARRPDPCAVGPAASAPRPLRCGRPTLVALDTH